jgi:hypothetical protein
VRSLKLFIVGVLVCAGTLTWAAPASADVDGAFTFSTSGVTATLPDYNPQTATSPSTAYVRERATRPEITLAKSVASDGSKVAVTAKGLTPGATYKVRLSAITILTAKADIYGEINHNATIPTNTRPGLYIVSLTGPNATASTVLVVN